MLALAATGLLLAVTAEAQVRITSYAIQASATPQTAPAQIRLEWEPDTAPVNTYSVLRREAGAGDWVTLANLVGTASSYTDTGLTAGRLYEYQIARRSSGLTGYSFLAAGIDLPLIEDRGKIVLVVERFVGALLGPEIDRLARDLAGDGWTVVRREVGRDDSPASVRSLIQTERAADPSRLRAVFLLGRVPVARSGGLNVDGHGSRPLPADTFYGDVDGTWGDSNGDGIYDPTTIPSDIDLMVGRVDMADLPVAGDEVGLLRRYLQKNHDYRHGRLRPAARALVGDRLGDFSGEAFSASGVRLFPALIGRGRTEFVAVEDNTPASLRWITKLNASDYLFVYGAGAGTASSIAGLGLNGQFFEARSADLVQPGARGTHYLMFGSWLVDWAERDNIMRTALATPNGLTAAWSGRPHLFFQHLAVGETFGYGIRISQNNSTLYGNQVNRHARGIHITLLGDPTLRLQAVIPPGAVQVAGGGGAPALSWGASPEATAGYHVYRGAGESGPFARVTGTPVSGTSFSDAAAPVGEHVYMVRAIRRETSGSATYFNASQGVFARASVTTPPANPPPAPEPPPPAPEPPPNPTPDPAPNPPANPPPSSAQPAPTGAAGGGGGAISWWGLAALAAVAALRAVRLRREGERNR